MLQIRPFKFGFDSWRNYRNEILSEIISGALERTKGNTTRAAKLIGIERTTLVGHRHAFGFLIYDQKRNAKYKEDTRTE